MNAVLANTQVRLLLGVPAAILITIALFLFMYSLIRSDEVVIEEVEKGPTLEFLESKEQQEVVRQRRVQPRKLDVADKPPPPPLLRTSRSDINLPRPEIKTEAPKTIDTGRVAARVSAPLISDRDAQPIVRPQQEYPQRMLQDGIEGSCEVRLDVNGQGIPYNIRATCTNSGFVAEAERVVSRYRYQPKIIEGRSVERRNVVQPLKWTLGE